MKTLHVVQSLDPTWSGIARALAELATALVEKGESCRIATLAGGRFGNPPELDGVEVLRFEASDSALGRSAECNRRVGGLVAGTEKVSGWNGTAACPTTTYGACGASNSARAW